MLKRKVQIHVDVLKECRHGFVGLHSLPPGEFEEGDVYDGYHFFCVEGSRTELSNSDFTELCGFIDFDNKVCGSDKLWHMRHPIIGHKYQPALLVPV